MRTKGSYQQGPRSACFYGMRTDPQILSLGTWLEPEEICYPSGRLGIRRARAYNVETGKLTIKRTGISIMSDGFVSQYIQTALWSSMDGDGNALDSLRYAHAKLDAKTRERMEADCHAFWDKYIDTINKLDYCSGDFDEEMIAHDFWLTRNRHGAGFWDGDYPDAVGKALTELAHEFGEQDLYVGDDGRIYL